MKTKEEIQAIIGLNVRKARGETGFSQFELALESDLHRNMVDLIERGQTMPTVFTIYKLSEALDVEFVDLLKEVK